MKFGSHHGFVHHFLHVHHVHLFHRWLVRHRHRRFSVRVTVRDIWRGEMSEYPRAGGGQKGQHGDLQSHLQPKKKNIISISTYCFFFLKALFLYAQFLSKKENVRLFSSSLPRFDNCHETSRIFPRTEQTFARTFGVIS